ncbi:MAG: PepSY domain-containing protein [Clostridia bacterium]|nr:PepSY domain-containing protein [Clostridia bacterium]
MKTLRICMLLSLMLLLLTACGVDPAASSEPDLISPTPTHTLAPTQPPSATPTISRDTAIRIALQTAGLSKASVRAVEAELDNDDGYYVWEVDFEANGREYAYDVDIHTGAIVEVDTEKHSWYH